MLPYALVCLVEISTDEFVLKKIIFCGIDKLDFLLAQFYSVADLGL